MKYLFLLLATLCFAQEETVPPSEKPQPRINRRGTNILTSWWTNDALCKELGLGKEQQETLSAQLNNLQISYQIEQTNLRDGRALQTTMLQDPTVSESELRKHNTTSVSAHSSKMQELNFTARLLARRHFTEKQMAEAKRLYPHFFSAPWFKRSQVSVRQGKVITKKKP